MFNVSKYFFHIFLTFVVSILTDSDNCTLHAIRMVDLLKVVRIARRVNDHVFKALEVFRLAISYRKLLHLVLVKNLDMILRLFLLQIHTRLIGSNVEVGTLIRSIHLSIA